MVRYRRTACRGVLLTPDNEILLTRIDNPEGNWFGWITPGGGIKPGESEEDALRREMHEELGLENFKIEAKIWTRYHEFPWEGRLNCQTDLFFLIRTARFEPKPQSNLSETEMIELKQARWWSLEELSRTQDTFSPANLYSLVTKLIQEGLPPEPVDLGT